LGSAVVSALKAKQWWVCCIDSQVNEAADASVVVDLNVNEWTGQEQAILDQVKQVLEDDTKFDSIINVAGGWAGGSSDKKDFVKNCDLTWKQSVWTSTIAARLASLHLKPKGLLVLPGADPALDGTPGMIGYGLAKAAVHQLTKSLAAPKSGLPEGASVFAILPVTLDTPMNRKWMAKADKSTWTPLEFVSDLMVNWTLEYEGRPESGSLVRLITKEGQTQLKMA